MLEAPRLLAVVAAVATVVLAAIAPAATARTIQRTDLLHHFSDAGTTGTMVVRHTGPRPQTVVVGARRSHARFLPSSTFKIPNSLLAIDRGVASGPGQPYPGPHPNVLVDGKPFLPPACEGDLTLATAFSSSCIPIYQGIARQLGRPAYVEAVHAMDYGNRRVSGAPLDSFWLEGPFAISAHEQVRFLERLRRGTLPVSRHAMRSVRSMMVIERAGGLVLRGKTGYVFSTSPSVGWWVGWVASRDGSWTFALNLDITRPEHAPARIAIGRAILAELGALPPGAAGAAARQRPLG
jgi:beta-lactamase class D